MKKQNYRVLVALLGLTLGVGQASAVNITIPDFSPGGGFGGGPFGGAGEDNETEPGTIQSQVWDMEAFVLQGTSLYVVGGYNMIAGEFAGAPYNRNLTSGDVFIKVGGTQPTYLPSSPGSGDIPNGLYGYTYAIDLSSIGLTTGAGSTNVYNLTTASNLNSVIFDQFGANPWKYDNSQSDPSVSTGISYSTGHANGSAAMIALGLGGLQGGSHNILQIDLGFLGSVPSGTQVWFSYTMECGNDSLKGNYGGGFDQGNVPDSGASIVLVALGLAAMSVAGYKRRKS